MLLSAHPDLLQSNPLEILKQLTSLRRTDSGGRGAPLGGDAGENPTIDINGARCAQLFDISLSSQVRLPRCLARSSVDHKSVQPRAIHRISFGTGRERVEMSYSSLKSAISLPWVEVSTEHFIDLYES